MEYLNQPIIQAAIVSVLSYIALNNFKPQMFYEEDGSSKMGLMNPLVASAIIGGVYFILMGMKKEGASQVAISGGELKDLNQLLPPEKFYKD
jgi:hypothetical protein